jgi:starch phosphorylase
MDRHHESFHCEALSGIQHAPDGHAVCGRILSGGSSEAEGKAKARDLAAWLSRVEREWPGIQVESAGEVSSEVRLGDDVFVSAKVTLKGLSSEDVAVEVVTGPVGARGEIKNPVIVPMIASAQDGTGAYLYNTVIQTSARSGLHGYAIRVLPRHVDAVSSYLPGLITWAPASTPVAELQVR